MTGDVIVMRGGQRIDAREFAVLAKAWARVGDRLDALVSVPLEVER